MESKGSAGGAAGGPATITDAATPATAPVPRGRWWTTSLLLLLAFMVLGVGPLALTARLLAPPGLRLPGLGPSGATLAPSPTATAHDFSLPRNAWVARDASVRAAAGSNTIVAELQPGFPVQIQAHATAGGQLWDRIIWAGPTPATGGQGWVPDSTLSAIGGAGAAVGDAAALAPSLAKTLQGQGANVGLAVYYPAAQQLYLTNGGQPYTLGDGARSLLLAALVAQVRVGVPTAPTPTTAGQPAPTQPPLPPNLNEQVAQGIPTATTLAYQQIGGNAGLAAFVSAYGLEGVTPGQSDWTQTQATPRALTQFYAALANLVPVADYGQLTSASRTQVLSLLAAASSVTPTDLAPLLAPPVTGAHVSLVAGAAQVGANSWTITVAGVVTLPNGVTYVIAACVHDAAARPLGEQALLSVLLSVATTTQA